MANYDLTTHATARKNNPKEVIEALETKLETVDDAKNIRMLIVVREGATWTGLTIYDA